MLADIVEGLFDLLEFGFENFWVIVWIIAIFFVLLIAGLHRFAQRPPRRRTGPR